MRRHFFLLVIFIAAKSFCQQDSLITFSEIMFYPQGTNNEFVELFNLSFSDSIDLYGWKIIYSSSAADNILSNRTYKVPPRSYAVVFEGDYDTINGIYNSSIPNDAIVFKIDNNSFGSSGMANTSNRTLFLVNSKGDTIETYTYSANNSAGFSDEKIIESKNNMIANWMNSKIINGTPGKQNSVSQAENDIRIKHAYFSPSQPKQGEIFSLFVVIENIGTASRNNINLKTYVDLNQDSFFSEDEIQSDSTIDNLIHDDSVEVSFKYSLDKIGKLNWLIVCDTLNDEDKQNNFYNLALTIRPPDYSYNDIVINELMYQPINDEPEWIELYNKSSKAINLIDWIIKDKSTNVKLSSISKLILPKEFLVIAKDSSIFEFYDSIKNVCIIKLPSLNNSDDEITLLDAYNNVIDSIHYFSSWGGNGGKSLERINYDVSTNEISNWATSLSLLNATPCLENSISPHEKDLVIRNNTKVKYFYELHDNVNINLSVINKGKETVSGFIIKEHVNKILKNENHYSYSIFSGDSIIIEYALTNLSSGKNDIKLELYVDNQEYADNNFVEFSINVVEINERRGDIVINEIMAAPISPMPEWIEIYNRSSKEINLCGYQIADAATKTKIVKNNFILKPENFLVISKDSLINTFYELDYFMTAPFPSLNNSSDKIILLDSLNRTIDSVFYKSSWGMITGYSLERIDVDASSPDSTNWNSSIAADKGTPGKSNSISIDDYAATISSFSFLPIKPQPEDELTFNAGINNIGKKELNVKLILYQVNNSLDSSIIVIEESQPILIPPKDSVNYIFQKTDKCLGFAKEYKLEVTVIELENKIVDSKNLFVYPAIPKRSVVINEIMYSPINSEPEWIELYNNSKYDFDLINTKISDVISTPLIRKITGKHLLLKAKNYLVVSKDSSIYDFHTNIKSNVVISNFANLNNDKDGVVIFDNYGDIIDSVFYYSAFGGTSGKSLERISSNQLSTDSSNWKSSNDFENSSPGRINSVSRKNYDLAVDTIFIQPDNPQINQPVEFFVRIKNTGFNEANNFRINATLQEGKNLLENKDTLISLLAQNEALIIRLIKYQMKESVNISVKCLFVDDEDTTNNKYSHLFRAISNRGDFVISEFMPYPKDDEPEWIEIFNNSNYSKNLKDYSIADKLPLGIKTNITHNDFYLNKNEFVILISDTQSVSADVKKLQVKIPNLGNELDGIILFDYNGAVIDSFSYKNIKIKKGVSLERKFDENGKNQFHYSIDKNGNTIGQPNSINSLFPIAKGSLLINEIMYEPSANNSEFIELYNTAEEPIQIGGAELFVAGKYICDLSDTLYEISKNDFYLIAGDSLILNKYSALDNSKIFISSASLGLTNTGSSVVIKDFFCNTIDSIYYSPDWHNDYYSSTKNISLERISFKNSSNQDDNWSSSVDKNGATPLAVNSIFIENKSSNNKLTIEPNPFSPDNDGFEDFTMISYLSKENVVQIRARIFDDKGRLVRHLVDNQIAGSKSQIIFDGRDDNGYYLNVGMYILLFESFNQSNKKSETFKKVIVIARKL